MLSIIDVLSKFLYSVQPINNFFFFSCFLVELEALANNYSERYGVLIRAWVAIIPFFVVFHPKDLQHILGSRRQSDKNFFYALMHNFIGEGLITNNGKSLSQKILIPKITL